MALCGDSFPGRSNSQYKDPEVGPILLSSRSREEADGLEHRQ